MKRAFIQAQFYETYYFATRIRNILHDQFAYIRHLNDFYGDGAYLSFVTPFPRFSAFHSFLEFVIAEVLTDDTEHCDLDIRQDRIEQFRSLPSALRDMEPNVLPIEHALRFHSIPHASFLDWLARTGKTFDAARDDDIYDYLDSLREQGAMETLLEQAVRETFYVLFGNRHLLMLFNQMLANQIQETVLAEIPSETAKFFEKDGVLGRVVIPEWVKRAVFYRDRGLCCACGCDLSGVLNIWSEEQYDHVVPLANGGMNDVTNIQLLCGACNRRKSDRRVVTSSSYEDWYEIES
jgi:hypothetical protein